LTRLLRESYWSPRLRRTANHRLWLWLWLPLRNRSPSCGAEIETGASLVNKKSGTRRNGPPMLNTWARGGRRHNCPTTSKACEGWQFDLKCQNAGENEENFRGEAKWLTCVQIKIKKAALTTLHGLNSLGIYLWSWSVKES
jgi:hypothetical protein